MLNEGGANIQKSLLDSELLSSKEKKVSSGIISGLTFFLRAWD